MWQVGLARLEVFVFFVTVQELCVLRQMHASPVLLLIQVAPEVYHLRLQKRQYGLDEPEVYYLRLHPVLACELDMLIFDPIDQKLHVSSGEQIAHAILAMFLLGVKSNTICAIVEQSAGEEYKPKAGHLILSPFDVHSCIKLRDRFTQIKK